MNDVALCENNSSPVNSLVFSQSTPSYMLQGSLIPLCLCYKKLYPKLDLRYIYVQQFLFHQQTLIQTFYASGS